MAKTKEYLEVDPGDNKLKTLVVQTVMVVLGRGFQSAAVLDPEIKKEIAPLKDGFTIMIKVLPDGPCLVLQKKKGKLKYIGSKEVEADLISFIKNIDAAFMMMTAQLGTVQAYIENRLSVKGDIAFAMTFIRCLDIVQAYLFPKIIAGLVVKRVPKLTVRKMINRTLIYTLGVPFKLL